MKPPVRLEPLPLPAVWSFEFSGIRRDSAPKVKRVLDLLQAIVSEHSARTWDASHSFVRQGWGIAPVLLRARKKSKPRPPEGFQDEDCPSTIVPALSFLIGLKVP
jgi:hypothetical protein